MREKILESFEKGIKKSLPEEVLNDEESMKMFRITAGASEPAAYAICALQEYGFEPDEDKPDYYGIFDFGGGTTDFDFGLWRCPTDSESRRYDYVIEHFGAGGDHSLGGENLLEMLAFNVFKDNREKLIQSNITFYKPAECKDFAGSEVLLSNSQEAKLNIKQLMEKLRSLWEGKDDDDVRAIEEGTIKLLLFTNEGELEDNFELDVDMDELTQQMTDRIEKGVRNFFDAMKINFSKEDIEDMDCINIFLAGNSSKSPIVKALFEKYIKENTEEMQTAFSTGDSDGEFFNIYPPLGTEEAKQIINGNDSLDEDDENNKSDVDEITKPTGKTGVAFGLIEGRPGSRIKVISEIKNTDEVKFKYYLGHNQRRLFKVDIDRDVKYGEWKYFIDASEEDFEIYYTSLPEASANKLPIKDINKKLCRISKADSSKNVYIRAVEPTVIEFAAATEEEIKSDNFEGEIVRVELE